MTVRAAWPNHGEVVAGSCPICREPCGVRPEGFLFGHMTTCPIFALQIVGTLFRTNPRRTLQ